jgi:hypothetical protein
MTKAKRILADLLFWGILIAAFSIDSWTGII